MPIWSYTTQLPPEYNELFRVSQIGVDAIKAVYGNYNLFKIKKYTLSFNYI